MYLRRKYLCRIVHSAHTVHWFYPYWRRVETFNVFGVKQLFIIFFFQTKFLRTGVLRTYSSVIIVFGTDPPVYDRFHQVGFFFLAWICVQRLRDRLSETHTSIARIPAGRSNSIGHRNRILLYGYEGVVVVLKPNYVPSFPHVSRNVFSRAKSR